MTSDYDAISADNKTRYGTDIGRIGPMLLANRYDDRTHFIFELLQNAEDALARRTGWHGSRAINFHLFSSELIVTHSGKPFDERDVRGICGIAESTKDLTAIGRFGIGFKSVYAFTDCPEVHSGNEDFAIENFVWPCAAARYIAPGADETVIVLPLRANDDTAFDEITESFKRLGPRILLFLRQIEEIAWHVEDGPSGLYIRSKPEPVGANAQRITVLGQKEGEDDIEETWLVFSREVRTETGTVAGQVEIAFAMAQDDESAAPSIRPISDSPLAVFFPTILPTHLGFLVQGPYRTTPSRDNVPRSDPWNQHLVRETASLVVEVLRSLRDLGFLNADALRCLPLSRTRFSESTMFAPLFDAVREALLDEALLPRFDTGYASARNSKLARTKELRELLSPAQLAELFEWDKEIFWLSDEITQDRAPELRQYILRELDIAEVTPEMLLAKLDEPFLADQPDDWIRLLYEFLQGQPALVRQGRLVNIPLVRLEDGYHVIPKDDGQPQAFLPGAVITGFPTVRRAVCSTTLARDLLIALGLSEPDPVDDVVRNILPGYCANDIDVSDQDYEADFHRILTAFETDSKVQREKLISALRDVAFVKAVDAGSGVKSWIEPGSLYLATERMRELFSGVEGVLLVDDAQLSVCVVRTFAKCLKLVVQLDICSPVPWPSRFTRQQLNELRVSAGSAGYSGGETVEDSTLRGLDLLLGAMSSFSFEIQTKKAALLWESLADLEDRRGAGCFSGTYRWFYYSARRARFDCYFVEFLNNTPWIPTSSDKLERPEIVVFETLSWKTNPFLLSKIHFKPPIIETLAREAGIEPGIIDLLKKLGVTSEAELRERLGEPEELLPEREPVNPERRATHVAEAAANAPERRTEVRSRSVSVGREGVKVETEQYLRGQYSVDGRMICQVCQIRMPFKLDNGTYYFEKVEFLPELRKHHYQNYLASNT